MEPEQAPHTKSLSRGWFVLLKDAKSYLHQKLLKLFTLIYKPISSFAPTIASAAVNSDVEPPTNPPCPSFSWLPDDIIINILARISRSYYPKLSLVSKIFRSLISSFELYLARYHFKTQENFLHVCLQLPDRRLPSWFSLWIKPDQILTNDMDMEENNKSNRDALLVEIPSSYSPRVPSLSIGMVGSKHYRVGQDTAAPTSSPVWFYNMGTTTHTAWRKAPRMKVARQIPVASILGGKIYVMGGCDADESTNWAEVLDTKTQTWESLPDPGPELRFSLIKTMNVIGGKLCVKRNEKDDYFYDPKEGRWEVVKGLEVLKRNCHGGVIALANYSGKLLVLWDKFEQPDHCQSKDIWCSVLALEKRNGEDQVWGNVEWARVVLTVPSSCVFLRCQVKLF
ncbi:putative F-box/kelch-repeat protein At5g28160 [Eutrema salsugineum]|uniref:putative F-box/kelch-repeat protein At5g28160 n=1 Tax=Eutrema salsugineum TaxID=72664 RepID=UPI000CED55DF|nr:putative F-box/kelch-repeat protein At5g28160 [Eutrema salsugineum]